MKASKFKKFVVSLEEEELREELLLLYSKLKEVKNHYAMELGSTEERSKIYDKAKAEIQKKYATKSRRRPRNPRIRGINSLLKELRNKMVFEHEMIDIYLFNVEQGIEFIRKYDYSSTPLYNTILDSYTSSINIIASSRLESDYEKRCEDITTLCRDYHLRQKLIIVFNSCFIINPRT